jgi:diaminohydroxyphosphoribosylaminopyrimidine deaminase/5-amino-6-(5-phosphoribosylamino)uracil reductase
VVVAGPTAPAERTETLKRAGAEVIVCDGGPERSVAGALGELGRREITSVLLEGGPTLTGAFLDAHEIDEVRLFLAPIVIGGAGARPLAGGSGARTMADATPALTMEWERSDGDLLVRARLREW